MRASTVASRQVIEVIDLKWYDLGAVVLDKEGMGGA